MSEVGVNSTGQKRIEELKQLCSWIAEEFQRSDNEKRVTLRKWHNEAKAELDYIRINGQVPSTK